ncbi:MAG TPA: heavy-metal-associated domain-containing protein [Methylomirabilota bacterium]|nr:heavy-metal-associated domain-containing protein [Methylomirabilota bacterium]
MKKIKLKIEGMHCTSCAMNIDGDLEDTGRVKSAKTNYAKAQTEVEFDAAVITQGEIVSIIKKTGYSAKPQV